MSTSLWSQNGKLVSNSGGSALTECSDCPCTPTTPGDGLCGSCVTVPLRWNLNISGIGANTNCANCDSYNGNFTLIQQQGHGPFLCDMEWKYTTCYWLDWWPDGCADFDGYGAWYLYYRTLGSKWFVAACAIQLNTNTVRYDLVGNFNCLGSNTFTIGSTIMFHSCNNWPDTVTVTPAP